MYIALIASAAALVYSYYLIKWVLNQDTGSESMKEIADAIKQGSNAYLKRQTINISYLAIPLTILLGYFLGFNTGVGFLLGAVASAIAGFLGMSIAVSTNLRTTQSAKSGLKSALNTAFKGGSVTGMLVVG